MEIRAFRTEDTEALVELSRDCARGETDFVLNPYWETADELHAEFDRLEIDPESHVLVADAGDGDVLGMAGFLRRAGSSAAGIFCPIVKKGERGRGLGGELLRSAQRLGTEKLGIRLMSAGIGTRNRAGYSLLTSHGFRPARQAFLMVCASEPTEEIPPVENLVFDDAKPEDADAILTVYRECGFEERDAATMQRLLEDGIHAHAVARHGGRVVAFTELETHWPRRIWVAFVGVARELRDRGVGSALVSWALRRRFAEGAVRGQLMLSPANRTALRAYEKVGFRRFRLIDVLEKAF
ncbi:MAG: GNAT family N-acetyltransferase [Myxococcota bacterium]